MPTRRGPSLPIPFALAVALAGGASAEPAPARVDPTTIPCADFVALAPAARTRVALWLDGFLKASRNRPEEVGDTALDRSLDGVVAACERGPTRSFLEVWTAHYPGGPTTRPPMRATCAELLALEPPARAALVSWLEGYAAGPQHRRISLPIASDIRRAVDACSRAPTKNAAKVLGAAP